MSLAGVYFALALVAAYCTLTAIFQARRLYWLVPVYFFSAWLCGELALIHIIWQVALTAALRERTNSDRFDFIARHRGMFSLTGLTPAEVDLLRDRHAIYLIGDSRMNVAGLKEDRIDEVAGAFAAVMG